MDFTKGHGTGNDFVLLSDPDGQLSLTDDAVSALCDRRFGVGGDGVIIATKTAAMPQPERDGAPGTEWFMDYRNADGSIAEMCGNGVRVFVEFLREQGFVDADEVRVGTRAGVKIVRVVTGGYSADLGTWTLDGNEPVVRAQGLPVPRPGLGIDVGNPHVVVALADANELAELDLHTAPTLEPLQPAGANVEFVVPLAIEHDAGHISMRVHERGSGETLSCGTGAVAAAMATRHWAGGSPDHWQVDVPGGTVFVDVETSPDGERVWLSGPAELTFRGSYPRS